MLIIYLDRYASIVNASSVFHLILVIIIEALELLLERMDTNSIDSIHLCFLIRRLFRFMVLLIFLLKQL